MRVSPLESQSFLSSAASNLLPEWIYISSEVCDAKLVVTLFRPFRMGVYSAPTLQEVRWECLHIETSSITGQ